MNDAIVVTVSQRQHQQHLKFCFFLNFFFLSRSLGLSLGSVVQVVTTKESKGKNVTLFEQFTENDHADWENVIVWWKSDRISFFCFFTE